MKLSKSIAAYSPLLEQLTGKIYLSTHQAFLAFAGEAEDYAI